MRRRPDCSGDTFLERFADAARHRINQIPVAADLRLPEIAELREVRFGRATNRSAQSTMNQVALDAEFRQYDRSHRPVDLEALGARLCETRCSAPSTHWP